MPIESKINDSSMYRDSHCRLPEINQFLWESDLSFSRTGFPRILVLTASIPASRVPFPYGKLWGRSLLRIFAMMRSGRSICSA